MTDKSETLYIFDTREAVWRSAAKDAVSVGMLVGTAWVLNTQMTPSAWLNAAVAICWFLWLLGKDEVRRRRVTPAEARAWIDSQFPEENSHV